MGLPLTFPSTLDFSAASDRPHRLPQSFCRVHWPDGVSSRQRLAFGHRVTRVPRAGVGSRVRKPDAMRCAPLGDLALHERFDILIVTAE